ncbi:hypothetical protein G6F35_016107 [Rhizopus arrhizus]|nr:hypothetical protein G6F35_016107 [Rhizopus arrhizus]
MFVHHDDGALRLLADHVTGAQGAHGALGGLHQERAARIGGDGYGHGAIQQADLAVGGREIQINAAACVQQQLAAVRQHVPAPLARGRGGVGGHVVQRVIGVADIGGASARTGERQRAGQKAASGRHDGRRRRDQRLRGRSGGVPGRVSVAEPAECRS